MSGEPTFIPQPPAIPFNLRVTQSLAPAFDPESFPSSLQPELFDIGQADVNQIRDDLSAHLTKLADKVKSAISLEEQVARIAAANAATSDVPTADLYLQVMLKSAKLTGQLTEQSKNDLLDVMDDALLIDREMRRPVGKGAIASRVELL